MNSTHKTYTLEEATVKLMQYCAYRDRSHKEVETKLNEMRMIPAAQEQIIIKLMQEDFLNEERFALKQIHKEFLSDDYDKYVNYFGVPPSDTFYEALAWKGLKN